MYPLNNFTIGFIWQCLLFIPTWIYNTYTFCFDKPYLLTRKVSNLQSNNYFDYKNSEYYYSDDDNEIDEKIIYIKSDVKKSNSFPIYSYKCSNPRCSIDIPQHSELYVLGDGLWCKYCWQNEFIIIKKSFQSP
jgi:hypothetical protein